MMSIEKPPRLDGQTGYERLIQEEGTYDEEKLSLDLQSHNDNASSSPARKISRWYHSRAVSLFNKALFVVLAVWGSVSLILFVLASFRSKQPISCNCGNSIAEAIARGCTFDGMSTAWLPPACRDEELSYEFDHSGPGPNGEWGYYADQDGNVSLSLQEVSMLAEANDGKGIWVTQEWCV